MGSRQRGREWLAAAQQPHHQQLETDAFWGQLSDLWHRLPHDFRRNIENNFLPENPMERPIPGEEVQLEIRPAWYRDIFGHLFFHNTWQIVVISLLIMVVLGIIAFVFQFTFWVIVISPLSFLTFALYAFRERIAFMQYRLVKTNARLVISLPQTGGWPFIDNIELKGLPVVLDTNWSHHPIWRLFQTFTGARDLYISMSAYQFSEGAAKVKDALFIPDVMADDAFQLKRLVFPPPDNKPGKVMVVDLSDEARHKLVTAMQEERRQLRPLTLRRKHRPAPPDSQ
ncbi:MAG: hypothetical protein KJ063_12235 [Anaerolineae bacterium]|nr:hypothetical protein [Anaerolineae bacterium]